MFLIVLPRICLISLSISASVFPFPTITLFFVDTCHHESFIDIDQSYLPNFFSAAGGQNFPKSIRIMVPNHLPMCVHFSPYIGLMIW